MLKIIYNKDGDIMYCKKCGAALPSHGYICKSCGAMMDHDQIKKQKEFMKQNEKNSVTLLSRQYQKKPIEQNYKKLKENKYLGAIFILIIMIILFVLALLKVM